MSNESEQRILDLAVASTKEATIQACISVCKRAQHNFKGGAPDYQGGAEACQEALKELLISNKQSAMAPMMPTTVTADRGNTIEVSLQPLTLPTPPEGRLVCEVCGELEDGKHKSIICRFLSWCHDA